jgi:hypothetical protein
MTQPAEPVYAQTPSGKTEEKAKEDTQRTNRFLNETKLLAVCCFYLLSNFIPIFLPVVAYLAYQGSTVCRAFWAITILDFMIPLKEPGFWDGWCKATNDVLGKKTYFNAKVVVEGTFEKDRNYLVCYHPHSLFGVGYNIFTTYLWDAYGIRTLFTGADVVLYIPLLRRALAWWGITPVTAPAMKRNLKRAYPYNVLTLLPGGVAEMFYGIGEDEQIILNKRKGFCKLALQTGASLVPCYAFGANQTYTRHFGPQSFFAKLSSRIQVSLVFWTDRFGIPFGLIPHKTNMIVALGQPIHVETVESPTNEQVAELHKTYVAALKELFNKHKGEMGPSWESKELLLEDERSKKED